jgi:hypothetical protein
MSRGAGGQRNRSHRSRPWLLLLQSVASQARCARTHCGRPRPRRSLERRMRWSTACVSDEGERSVKPSAQPTLVRTQHLPTPATTCGNGPLAANSRASGAFLLCPGVCHLVALWTVALRGPRTHSGRESVSGSGVGSRLTGFRCPFRGVPGLTWAAESSVHPGVSARRPASFPGARAAGRRVC